MPGGEPVSRRAHRHPHRGDDARFEGSRLSVGRPMGQVQDAGADLEWRAVLGDVLEPDDGRRDGLRRLPGEDDRWAADDIEVGLERRGGEGREERVVRAEVAGDPVRLAARAP